jgi:hypothetical protein
VLDAVEADNLVADPLAGAENEMKKLIEKGEFPGIIWDTNIADQRIGEAETARVTYQYLLNISQMPIYFLLQVMQVKRSGFISEYCINCVCFTQNRNNNFCFLQHIKNGIQKEWRDPY